MSGHTRAPWRAMQHPHTKGPPSTAPEDAHLDYFHIEAGEVGADGWTIAGYMRPADAPLIAAAPDLLEAAKAIAAASYGVALGDLERLEAAIAKAEGQS